MSRRARIIMPGHPHHIVQRGHNRQTVFRDDHDRRLYLGLLAHYLRRNDCGLMMYCIMRNHVHLMIRPPNRKSLVGLLHGLGFRYAMYFNETESRTGALWENRYFSSVITEEAYMWRAAQYICFNPVRAGIVMDPCDYKWSGARALLLGEKDGVPVEDWVDKSQIPYLRESSLDQAELESINFALRRNLPYASATRLLQLERDLGTHLFPRPRGHPKNQI
jgi:putative transposase